MLNSMTGYDRLDITSVEHPKEDYIAGMRQPVKGLRLGMPVGHFDNLQPDVQKAVMEAIDLLGTMTKGVKDMTLPPLGARRQPRLPRCWLGMNHTSSAPR